MALKISEKNETFYVSGKINTTTARPFIVHFEYIIEERVNVVLNIDAITEIDRDGLEAIKTVKAIALRNQKLFSVIGNGCKDIYQHFNASQVA